MPDSRPRDRRAAGLGKTVDGDFLSKLARTSELLHTIAGYLAIALDNAQALQLPGDKKRRKSRAAEGFLRKHRRIVARRRAGRGFRRRGGIWNTQLEGLVGVPRQEAVGRRLEDVLPSDLMAEITARSGDERVSSLYKFHMQNREGRNLVVNVSIAPLVGKSGDRIGRLILFDDAVLRRWMRLEEQVFQNEKLTSLGLLAAGVAHEVNTPLAVISNYIQMLAKQLPSGDPRHQLIEKVVKQTFRAGERGAVQQPAEFFADGRDGIYGSEFKCRGGRSADAGRAPVPDGASAGDQKPTAGVARGAGLDQQIAAGFPEPLPRRTLSRRHALRRRRGDPHGGAQRIGGSGNHRYRRRHLRMARKHEPRSSIPSSTTKSSRTRHQGWDSP